MTTSEANRAVEIAITYHEDLTAAAWAAIETAREAEAEGASEADVAAAWAAADEAGELASAAYAELCDAQNIADDAADAAEELK